MKKTVFALAVAMAAGLYAEADPTARAYTYSYTDEDGLELPVVGPLRRVSPNGLWAVGGDEAEDSGSFIINTGDPENVTMVFDGLILDVDDNGMAVGCWYEVEGSAYTRRASVYKDGVWTMLPMPEEIIGQSYAVAISDDSSIIGGHAMCANADPSDPGKYFPIFWKLDPLTGEYELDRLYNDLYLPGTMGFFSYDMTPDGEVLCGLQCLDMGDYVAAIFDRTSGQVKIWHDITFRTVDFDYKGQTFYYDDVMFVDGVMDGGESGEFRGMFTYATDRYIFGSRDVVSDVDDEGEGLITTYSTIYDRLTGEFFDGRKSCAYFCGVSPEQNFTSSGLIDFITPEDGEINLDINEYLDYFCELTDAGVDGVYSIDRSSRVWGASRVFISPLGEILETPVLVMLDNPVFTGIDDVVADRDNDVKIWAKDGRMAVSGATKVSVYTVGGSLVDSRLAKSGTDVSFSLSKGVYIIVADGVARKVVIR